jgi:hypothetical protein
LIVRRIIDAADHPLPCSEKRGWIMAHRLMPLFISAVLVLGTLAGCAGITPRPDLIIGGVHPTPQGVYAGGG